jgi:hypothetical protein
MLVNSTRCSPGWSSADITGAAREPSFGDSLAEIQPRLVSIGFGPESDGISGTDYSSIDEAHSLPSTAREAPEMTRIAQQYLDE